MFEAVYTPSILTILGVIMYQRLGWVVGEAGLVKAGGNYYIISRSLGLSIGGATISSVLGSILGAARTLQALAFDGVVPKIFGKGRGELNEPTYALFLTVAIAESLVQSSGIITYFNLIKGKIIEKYENFKKEELKLNKYMNEK